MNTSVAFHAFITLCKLPPLSSFKTFCLLTRLGRTPPTLCSNYSQPPSPGSAHLLSHCADVPVLEISWGEGGWDHKTWDCCVSCLSRTMFLRLIQVVACVSTCSLFMVNALPLYGHTTLSTHLLCFCCCFPFVLMDYFHLLAFMIWFYKCS